MAHQFAKVGVVGLGTMGAGIAEVFARSGIAVTAVEIAPEALERGRAHLVGSTQRAVTRGKLTQADADALLGRVTFALGLDALADADLVVEAVPERLDLKRSLVADLDRICRPDAILATNTSSLPVTEIAVATARPAQVLGMHFFNPAPVMRLVEIVTTVVTAPEVAADVGALCSRLGKVGVTIGDRAGFIANALLFGYLNQAITMYDNGRATREDLDAAMRFGHGLPMGPLTLLDLIGLDTSLEILDTMYARGGRSRRHAAAPLLRQMVTAGLLGRKTGRGFYTYAAAGSGEVVPDGCADGSYVGDGPDVRRIGVVGPGPGQHAGYAPDAGEIAETLVAAGYEVIFATPPDLDGLAGVDLVVEAAGASETMLAALGRVGASGMIIATTGLPVIEKAAASGRPEDVVGLHVLGPVPAAGAIEVVRTVASAPEAVRGAKDLVTTLGRHPVVCDDRAGLLADALLFPYLNDAVRMVEGGYATANDVDHAMELGCGYPAGPFEMLDRIGLDVALAVQQWIFDEEREPALAPAPLLRQMVTAGYLGRKAGRGFRPYAT